MVEPVHDRKWQVNAVIKGMLYRGLTFLQADRLFRYLNREKLLVLMYHGVTRANHHPPVWTQLPVEIFSRQMEFIHRHYHVIQLEELLNALEDGRKLQENSALITFDDGLRNNYTVAYPILKRLGLPATIFLTVDLMGSDRMFWFDRLYLLIKEGVGRDDLPLQNTRAVAALSEGKVWEAYSCVVETLKRTDSLQRERFMDNLAVSVKVDTAPYMDDFGMLTWEQINEMQGSGFIDFGIHTATHRILTELREEEWHPEIVNPVQKTEKLLGRKLRAFCFPNGRPHVDFDLHHKSFLESVGYCCAFSTENQLFDLRCGDRMAIGRVPAGNDGTSDPACFRISTSGAFQAVRTARHGFIHLWR